MTKTVTAIVALFLIAAAALAARGLPQQAPTFPRPTLDTGPVRVEGNVAISNNPVIHAVQDGNWSVAVSSMPPVTVAPMDIVSVGRTYRFGWVGKEEVSVRVVEIRAGGWVLTTSTASDQRVWYNLGQVEWIRE